MKGGYDNKECDVGEEDEDIYDFFPRGGKTTAMTTTMTMTMEITVMAKAILPR